MVPTEYDRILQIGSNQLQWWVFPADFSLGGSEFVLTISIGDTLILTLRSELGELWINDDSHLVVWPMTVAQSRLIPLGQVARYELERRVFQGEQLPYFRGYLIGEGGLNADD